IKGIDPEAALQRSNDKFLRRFNYIEEEIKSRGDRWEDYRLEELDAIWDEAKGQGL
ncbi:MAG: nucleoside triphosphate pyrophosphohydrolase, partial [Syntrophomonadaceae bacterium]|nr:nucleoside triphosphate pyrophosphohydrolase [Syntrophomonadaceae bacterium]